LTGVSEDLRIAVATFAARPRVLVAVDFDGTLAPFVTDPLQAKALPGGLEALRAAAGLYGVTVAVVSGRDLATLSWLTGIGPGDGITLIGSHGAQTNLGDQTTPADQTTHGARTTPADHPGQEGQPRLEPVGQGALLDDKATSRLASLGDELEAIRSRYPAVRLEYKPSAVVLHTRGVEPLDAAAATKAAHEVGARHTGVHVLPGKNVVELTVLEANKGSALVDLARTSSSDATLYLGDDVTDERAFAALDPSSGDLTVKVGDGETVAAQRVSGPETVVELLNLFVDMRRVPGLPG
jgi:trehalose 6-phosphate phosphatase